METFESISCAPVELYGKGGFYDGDIGLDRLVEMSRRHPGQIETIAEIFPSHTVRRSTIASTISPDPSFAGAVDAFYRGLDARYFHIAPSFLVRIRNAVIWNNMLFVVLDDRAVPVYEMYRANDRMEKGQHVVSRLAAREIRKSIDLSNINGLFVGSAGSFNYGHWLIDDFPMFAASHELRKNGRTSTVLMSGYFAELDRTRQEGVALAFGETADYRVHMLDPSVAYRVENIHYVTPATYHAHLKNPFALKFIRKTYFQTLFDEQSCVSSDKLFINRPEGFPRRISNNEQVAEILKNFGFAEVKPEKLSLREQWATFANANHIIGVMGAAMASSLLCVPGTKLTYLTPQGWIEPFYWDLADMIGHSYTAVFGSAEETTLDIYRKNFSVDIPLLTKHVSTP